VCTASFRVTAGESTGRATTGGERRQREHEFGHGADAEPGGDHAGRGGDSAGLDNRGGNGFGQAGVDSGSAGPPLTNGAALSRLTGTVVITAP